MAATVDKESGEYARMKPAWQLIADVRAGGAAVRAQGVTYLPKFEDETEAEHKRRVDSAPWRPEFADILGGLVGKPFSRDVTISDDAPDQIKAVYENVDQRGNNLTVFARDVFAGAMADGWATILVDYPSMQGARTLADAQRIGARPYWVHVPASSIIALYSRIEAGVEIIEHARILETETVREGFEERTVERIRVLETGRWELWENIKGADDKLRWEKVAEGTMSRNGKTSVPMARIWLGQRLGNLAVQPPLLDLAEMQIELYRALSRKDEVMTYSAAPLLALIGVEASGAPLPVGPRRVLYIPPGEGNAKAEYLVPPAANVQQIRDDVKSIIDDMRRLGMQPLVQKAGNMVATAAAIDASRAHSVLQAWAMLLKDGLERAFTFTAEYLKIEDKTEVSVHTDFSAGMGADDGLGELGKARERGDISRRTYQGEAKRRGVLSADFDADDEEEQLATEGDPAEPEQQIDPATGRTVPAPGQTV
jgi:hypothetical protein